VNATVSQMAAMGETAQAFVRSVLELEAKIAVCDCDGTLWAPNSGEEFFYWSIEQRLVAETQGERLRARYADYLRGNVAEDTMCGEMTAMYAGLPVARVEAAAAKFFEEYIRPRIFAEMHLLTRALAARGCELWAVSSTNEWLVRYAVRDFSIPRERVLAAAVECLGGTVSERIIRVPTGEGKAEAIRQHVSGQADMVFGNSVHDAAMLRLGRHAFAVNPTDSLEREAEANSWPVYWPEGIRASK
jgi:phosphoserine phosphatase